MKLGVDLRVLQIGHQYRGVGEVTKQCMNRIFERAISDKENNISFVFYRYEDEIDPKDFLEIPKELVYEEVILGNRPKPDAPRSRSEKLVSRWRNWFGNPVPKARRCDVFLQFDFALGVPRKPNSVLVSHDLIPYIFWNDFFESPWVHVKHKAARTTLRTLLNNSEYVRVLKRSHRNATCVVCVSESTRRDLNRYLHVPLKKMVVDHLGVSMKAASTGKNGSGSKRLPTKPFLLFIGGIDARRRRVDELIAAYNNMKASGHDIQLVLVGENFQSAETIPSKIVRQAVLDSSYREDILTLGYIDDKTKQDLYKNAVAFVFPTMYEGFGIPVLEAMLLGCPVIAYNNSSIPEVGGKYALYAKNWEGLWHQSLNLLEMTQSKRHDLIAVAKKHAEEFTWDKTSKTLYEELLRVAKK